MENQYLEMKKEKTKKKKKSVNKNKKIEAGKITKQKVIVEEDEEEPKGRSNSAARRVINERGRDYGNFSRQQTNFMPYMEGKEDQTNVKNMAAMFNRQSTVQDADSLKSLQLGKKQSEDS